MTEAHLTSALQGLKKRVIELAFEDSILKEHLTTLAMGYLAYKPLAKETAIKTPSIPLTPIIPPEPVSSVSVAPRGPAVDSTPPITRTIMPEVNVKPVSTQIELPPPLVPKDPMKELDRLIHVFKLKADCVNWLVDKQAPKYALPVGRKEAEFTTNNLLDKATTIGTSLWMLRSFDPMPTNVNLRILEGCYKLLSEGLYTAQLCLTNQADAALSKALGLCNLSQNALRAIVGRVWSEHSDIDQSAAYYWIQNQPIEKSIIKVQIPDDQTNAIYLTSLWDLIAKLKESLTAGKQQDVGLGLVQHHLKSLNDPNKANVAWNNVINVIDRMVDRGLPASNADLRALLLPHIDKFKINDNEPKGFKLVRRFIGEYLATKTNQTNIETKEDDKYSEDVALVREIIKGTKMVLIGGIPNNKVNKGIIEAFGLKELEWVGTTGKTMHPSNYSTVLRDPSISVVVLLSRWASQSYTMVKDICLERKLSLVRGNSGYNPNQLARNIMEQM